MARFPGGCQLGPLLQVGRLYLDRNRSHEEINRKYEAEIVLLAHENSFHTSQGAVLDLNPLADFHEGTRFDLSSVPYTISQSLNFVILESGWMPTETYESHHAGCLQYPQAFFGSDPNKHVSGKQWEIQLFLPVLPAANAAVEWQEAVDVLFFQLSGNMFFMMGTGVGCIPAGHGGGFYGTGQISLRWAVTKLAAGGVIADVCSGLGCSSVPSLSAIPVSKSDLHRRLRKTRAVFWRLTFPETPVLDPFQVSCRLFPGTASPAHLQGHVR